MKTVIVVPHHLPTLEFLNEWQTEFDPSNTHIIIVEDKPRRQTTLEDWMYHQHVTVYTHDDINKELGGNSWIIPRGTSAIRSYGLYKAWQMKPEMIVTIDNDCFPNPTMKTLGARYFLQGHLNSLNTPATLDWVASSGSDFLDMPSRGFPYKIRDKAKTYINHGLWSNIPDLDAAQMLQYPKLRTMPVYANESIVIPRFSFYPQCSMNLAFRPEATPLLYHGLFGPEYGFDQFDDITAGVISKKVLDHLGGAVRSGYPSVEHRKQSDAFTNFRKQAGGLEMNEYFWQAVRDVELTSETIVDCYRELITKLPDTILSEPKGWMKKYKKAALIWSDLFI